MSIHGIPYLKSPLPNIFYSPLLKWLPLFLLYLIFFGNFFSSMCFFCCCCCYFVTGSFLGKILMETEPLVPFCIRLHKPTDQIQFISLLLSRLNAFSEIKWESNVVKYTSMEIIEFFIVFVRVFSPIFLSVFFDEMRWIKSRKKGRKGVGNKSKWQRIAINAIHVNLFEEKKRYSLWWCVTQSNFFPENYSLNRVYSICLFVCGKAKVENIKWCVYGWVCMSQAQYFMDEKKKNRRIWKSWLFAQIFFSHEQEKSVAGRMFCNS